MTDKPQAILWASFASSDQLVAALSGLRDKGLAVRDVYTPFPLAELDWPPPATGRYSGVYATVAGLAAAMAMLLLQVWSAGYDYPYVVSGKPLFVN